MKILKKIKGFTLIELLAVIVILSLIIMISSPIVVSIINNNKSKSTDLSYNNIKKSSILYVKEYPYNTNWVQSDNNNEYTCINLETLVNEGLLDRKNMAELFKDSEYVIQDNNNLNSISVRLTRNINTKSIIKEEIEDSATCSTNINLDVEVIPTVNSITVKGICTSKNEPNTIFYSKDKINWEGESVTKADSSTTYTFSNDIKSLTKYTIYAKCTTSTGEYIIKKTTTLTSNYGVLSIKYEPNNSCSNDKTITINSTTDITKDNYKIQYKLGNNGTWTDYSEPFKIIANTTIYARYYADENNISDYISSTITTIDRGTPSINVTNINKTTNSATIDYEVTTNSTCGTTTYTCKYGTSQENYSKTAEATSSNCKITDISPGIKYYYQITATNANGNKGTKEGEFTTSGKAIIKYNVNGGTISTPTTDTSADKTYYWKTDSNGIILRSTDNSNYSEAITQLTYGSSLGNNGLANYNNSSYINITKTNYKAVSGAEWKCLSGCTTTNKTYSQSSVYNDSDFCDASKGDCEVVLGVNWISNKPPKCTLTVTGVNGDNGWYKEKDITITLNRDTNGGTAINSYGLTNSNTANYNSKTSITQSDTAKATWYGWVKNEAGLTGSCNVEVKVDTEAPTISYVEYEYRSYQNYSFRMKFTKDDNLSGVSYVGYSHCYSDGHSYSCNNWDPSVLSTCKSGEWGDYPKDYINSDDYWYSYTNGNLHAYWYLKDNAGNYRLVHKYITWNEKEPTITNKNICTNTGI